MYVYLPEMSYIVVPLSAVATLGGATGEQLNGWELSARGTGIHWEELHEDLSILTLARKFGIRPADCGATVARSN